MNNITFHTTRPEIRALQGAAEMWPLGYSAQGIPGFSPGGLHYLGLFMAGLSFGCGAFCIKYPNRTIEFQQYFYSKINWRIEPISMAKEIRNTRIMGIFLLILPLATFYLLIRRLS